MILYDLTNNEQHPAYEQLEIANINRQYDFLRSLVLASLAAGKPFLSQHILKALNFHAIACLHDYAGEYRPCTVTVGIHQPPAHYRVPALMEDFVNTVNRIWESDPVVLASLVLWRLNHIHPFVNGNGRTARAASYFVLCVRAGGWLPGDKILPELLRHHRDEYVQHLIAADESLKSGTLDLSGLHGLVSRLLKQQLSTAEIDEAPAEANTDS